MEAPTMDKSLLVLNYFLILFPQEPQSDQSASVLKKKQLRRVKASKFQTQDAFFPLSSRFSKSSNSNSLLYQESILEGISAS